ncbi:hypothetical protein [Virgibacillus sp.]|uniref:hypothetical protein n=1 Tax=Virgibacillus sp. TaxID=1872700 RepID=UPI00179E7F01|nr:hypothetical protein [Virgibacillus sp.]NWO12415.1 hypothetical protein [Virgibacillus sp.]
MKIKINKIKLIDSINILDELPLKGLKSIHRSRLREKLTSELERVIKEEKQLKKDYSNVDEKGEPIINDGYYDIRDMDNFQKVLSEFYQETIIIDDNNDEVYLESVKGALEDADVQWSGKKAIDYAYLYDAFQTNKG